jgi:hypothetical protein
VQKQHHGGDPPLERIVRETEANQQAFLRLRAGFVRHEGEYALMKSGLILDFFASPEAAMLAGYERCIDRIFSIHRVRAHDRRKQPRDEQPTGDLP